MQTQLFDCFLCILTYRFLEEGFVSNLGSYYSCHSKLLSCETDIAKKYLKALLDWGVLRESVLDLGEEQVTVFELNHFARNKLFILGVVDAYAKEISVRNNNMYCWAG